MNNYLNQKKELQSWGIECFDEVPSEFIAFLKKGMDKNNPKNHELAGHIKQEYTYPTWPIEFETWLIDQIFTSVKLQHIISQVNVLTDDLPFCLKNLWVNIQKKHEFNPLHNHSGVFSFIIPLNIPYDLKKEDKHFPQTSFKHPCTSKLSFIVHNSLGAPSTLEVNVDKSFENKMLMFSSKLLHQVYPFYTSNGERITVSGNISLKVNK